MFDRLGQPIQRKDLCITFCANGEIILAYIDRLLHRGVNVFDIEPNDVTNSVFDEWYYLRSHEIELVTRFSNDARS